MRKIKVLGLLLSLFAVIWIAGCKKDPPAGEQINLPAGATLYDFSKHLPPSFPPMKIPSYNLVTNEGVALGRKLFNDPLLSGNNKQACASCHQQKASFVDSGARFSKGSTGVFGGRNSMPIINVGYARAWFWDGKAKTLEEQVFHPLTSQNEMNQDPILLANELSKVPEYVTMYNAAFGEGEITFDKTAKAIAQFMRTIVAYTPKSLDKSLMSESEKRGLDVFLDEEKGDCFHCHELGNFLTTYDFVNNGLNLNAFSDPGLYAVTGKFDDLGKFKTPSLINIKYTAPYMHDGRFQTLRQVIDFYDTGFVWHRFTNPTLDAPLQKHFDKTTGKPKPRKWTEQDKLDIIEFMNGLNDESVLTKKEFGK